MKRHLQFRAFTLVELLVVIAIIAILIALLIGPVMRARRQALVLACPIATQAPKQSILVIHPRGNAELEVAPAFSWGSEVSGPEWSSSGTWIGYTTYKNPFPNKIPCVALLHVASGKVRLHTSPNPNYQPGTFGGSYFKGWADDDHFITGSGATLYICEATTGQLTQTFELPYIQDGVIEGITRVPPSTGAYYIAGVSTSYTSPRMIALLRKDFSIKKTIYLEKSFVGAGEYSRPRVDPMGEYAAWTMAGKNRRSSISVKALSAPLSSAPQILDPSSYGVLELAFADWTEDGSLLVFWSPGIENVGWTGLRSLKIFSRTGKPLDTIMSNDQYDWGSSGGASYRIYRHQ